MLVDVEFPPIRVSENTNRDYDTETAKNHL